MYEEEIKIPKDRIAVLIGEKGSTKRLLEERTSTRIEIDSREGDINISGEDNFNIFITKNIIRAIGRGFNPSTAIKLLSEDTYFELINLVDFAGKSKSKMERLKSRVIGTRGKCRSTIERMTNTNIVIYGKTISIIGKDPDVVLAKRALEMILQGSQHGNAYRYIQQQKQRQETLI